MNTRLSPPALPAPGDLDRAQVQTAIADLCTQTFVIVERRAHAVQLYTVACRRRIPVRLPHLGGGGWRVELD